HAGRRDRLRIVVEAANPARPRPKRGERVDPAAAPDVEKVEPAQIAAADQSEEMTFGDLQALVVERPVDIARPILAEIIMAIASRGHGKPFRTDPVSRFRSSSAFAAHSYELRNR